MEKYGGNIRITSPDNTLWEIDAYNNLRIFTYANNIRGITINKYGVLSSPNGFVEKLNGNANNGITYSDSEPTGLSVGATWIGN